MANSCDLGVRDGKYTQIEKHPNKDIKTKTMKAIELFAGAGGLAMGTSNAGFKHLAVIEWNKDACDTLNLNKLRGISPVSKWPIHQLDVCEFDYSSIPSNLDLLAGGPPCQPFSLGGKHRGRQDNRNMFPQTVRAVRETSPRAVMLENVKGLTRASFTRYFEYIRLQHSYPEIGQKAAESWLEHLTRLEQYHTGGKHDGLFYRIVTRLLNAADYGVPQRRERVFIIGFRGDQEVEWAFPKPTHSQDALLWDQWISGEYWERHGISKRKIPAIANRFKAKVEALRSVGIRPDQKAWVTVRDAISDLPAPSKKEQKSSTTLNHRLVSGARSYAGHTGSPIDEPSKTLKAGDHGVPGGENMLAMEDGSVRYFTVRESARMQTFPDNYLFDGSWSEAMRQLGNAVPVKLANSVANSVAACLKKAKTINGR
jgi:DNA (cytosine-5)-methyltransferase 1